MKSKQTAAITDSLDQNDHPISISPRVFPALKPKYVPDPVRRLHRSCTLRLLVLGYVGAFIFQSFNCLISWIFIFVLFQCLA